MADLADSHQQLQSEHKMAEPKVYVVSPETKLRVKVSIDSFFRRCAAKANTVFYVLDSRSVNGRSPPTDKNGMPLRVQTQPSPVAAVPISSMSASASASPPPSARVLSSASAVSSPGSRGDRPGTPSPRPPSSASASPVYSPRNKQMRDIVLDRDRDDSTGWSHCVFCGELEESAELEVAHLVPHARSERRLWRYSSSWSERWEEPSTWQGIW